MTPLPASLQHIGLMATASSLDDLIARATEKRWSPLQLLEHVADIETKDRAERGLLARQRTCRIQRFKPMAQYDWAWPKKIDRQLVESLLSLDFLDAARNVVLVGPSGVGKTMIAKNLAHQAILKGKTALFVTAAELLLSLNGQDSAKALDRRLAHYARPSLLVLDELGFLPFDNRNADLLFQVVNRRYEKKSIVLTTNLAFVDWPSVFPSSACTSALVERLIHHADVVPIESQSFRVKDAQEHAAKRTK